MLWHLSVRSSLIEANGKARSSMIEFAVLLTLFFTHSAHAQVVVRPGDQVKVSAQIAHQDKMKTVFFSNWGFAGKTLTFNPATQAFEGTVQVPLVNRTSDFGYISAWGKNGTAANKIFEDVRVEGQVIDRENPRFLKDSLQLSVDAQSRRLRIGADVADDHGVRSAAAVLGIPGGLGVLWTVPRADLKCDASSSPVRCTGELDLPVAFADEARLEIYVMDQAGNIDSLTLFDRQLRKLFQGLVRFDEPKADFKVTQSRCRSDTICLEIEGGELFYTGNFQGSLCDLGPNRVTGFTCNGKGHCVAEMPIPKVLNSNGINQEPRLRCSLRGKDGSSFDYVDDFDWSKVLPSNPDTEEPEIISVKAEKL